MKNIYKILIGLLGLVVIVLALGVYKFNFTNDDIYMEDGTKYTDNIKPVTKTEQIKDGKYCYSYSHEATATEPYKVNEKIIINKLNNEITGTKTGNQSGPDMTNGYWGDLKGSIKDTDLELVYSYTVEGSKNSELEIYKYEPNSLIKMRWPLVEKNKMLVPDKTGNPKQMIYNKQECESPTPPVVKAPDEQIVACTMDAKQCPDGTYVGRSGPKCEFICN